MRAGGAEGGSAAAAVLAAALLCCAVRGMMLPRVRHPERQGSLPDEVLNCHTECIWIPACLRCCSGRVYESSVDL